MNKDKLMADECEAIRAQLLGNENYIQLSADTEELGQAVKHMKPINAASPQPLFGGL